MHCRIHKENFLSENGCPQCIKAWMFRADSKISEIHKGVEAMAVSYDNMKQTVSDLEDDVGNQVQMRLDAAKEFKLRIAILVLEKESLERNVKNQDIMLAQDEKKLARARVKLDTTQWEHMESLDREAALRGALRTYGCPAHEIERIVELPKRQELRLTGFVPGGMIETHKMDCNIWRKWRGQTRECTCRNCRWCGLYPCDCARDC